MRGSYIAVALAASGSLFPQVTSAQATTDPLETRVTVLRDGFVDAVKACGVEPAFVPAVSISTDASVISYYRKTLIVGRWEELPPPIQGFADAWAAQVMPGEGGQALYDRIFNGFLVGHELGHWVGDWSGRWATLDRWDSEMEANRFAIAFAKLDPTTAAELERTVAMFDFLHAGPGPTPAGEDERTYFDENYETLATRDPIGYSWFQGRLMQLAWEQRDTADFCALVKLPPDTAGRNPDWSPRSGA